MALPLKSGRFKIQSWLWPICYAVLGKVPKLLSASVSESENYDWNESNYNDNDNTNDEENNKNSNRDNMHPQGQCDVEMKEGIWKAILLMILIHPW